MSGYPMIDALNASTPTTRETADHIGEANEKVADHIGDVTTMIDHAELARLAEDALIPMPEKRRRSWFNRQNRFRDAFTPAVCSALLSEIAALRVHVTTEKRLSVDNWNVATARATQAERQRDELRTEGQKFADFIIQMNAPDQGECLTEDARLMFSVASKFRAFLANQGADQ